MATNPETPADAGQDTVAPLPLPLPPLPVLPSTKTVALRLLKWAKSRDLLLPDSFAPTGALPDPIFQPDLSITALSQLRQKQISFVGSNESATEVIIFLHRAVPGERTLKIMPKTADGVNIRFRQGNLETVNPGSISEAATACTLHTAGAIKFYTCGSSVSVGNARGAGTLGCLLMKNGVLMGLSNNHVTGSCSYAPVGMPITAPGVMDVNPANPPPFTIGFHHEHLLMIPGDPSTVQAIDNLDAAMFRIADEMKVSSMQRNFYDTPAGVLPLQAGMNVEKIGRTTGRTIGRVVAEIVGPSGISYAAAAYNFSGKVHFEPLFVVHGLTDRFSEAGDSGSLVTHRDAAGVRHAVGIVVGGGVDTKAPGQKNTLILPLEPILHKLGATLVTGHNV